jgi:hypothetical protein
VISMSDIKHIFIISKPLQFMIALIIRESFFSDQTVAFFIVDKSDWSGFISKREISSIDRIFYFSSPNDAYKALRFFNCFDLFIDSDIGFKKHIQLACVRLFNRTGSIYVYEEGIGTYRNDLYSGAKKYIFDTLGIATFFGGSVFVNGIYLYDKERYLRSNKKTNVEVIELKKSIRNYIFSNIKMLTNAYELGSFIQEIERLDRIECTLYLTSWGYSKKEFSDIGIFPSPRILKPHPHIGNDLKNIVEPFDYLVPGSVPAELIILILLNYFKKVNVVHHGSSVAQYITDKDVNYILLNEVKRLKF